MCPGHFVTRRKRGGAVRVTFDEMGLAAEDQGHDLAALDDALVELGKVTSGKPRD